MSPKPNDKPAELYQLCMIPILADEPELLGELKKMQAFCNGVFTEVEQYSSKLPVPGPMKEGRKALSDRWLSLIGVGGALVAMDKFANEVRKHIYVEKERLLQHAGAMTASRCPSLLHAHQPKELRRLLKSERILTHEYLGRAELEELARILSGPSLRRQRPGTRLRSE